MANIPQKIVIIGGGTAGWLSASGIAKYLEKLNADICLIESEEIGIIGVGEASIPPLSAFNKLLGIDEKEFIRKTKASFKLGIEFIDWKHLNHSYIHPFGSYGQKILGIDFQHIYSFAELNGHNSDFGNYSMNVQLAKYNRFALPSKEANTPLSTVNYAYHFDASLYARFLREYSEKLGVKRIEGKITEVHQNNETGFITGVSLENGKLIEGDFFIDCSGMRGLLIEQTLGAGYEDWRHLLPCNRAIAVPCEGTDEITPYTKSIARSAGWQWRIPLQHRIGNGYVYSNDHINDEDAAQTLLSNLDGKALADPRIIPFTPGRRKSAWVKNCVAIGLSAGFLEPLESTSIHLIQIGITKLIRHFPTKVYSQSLVNNFNAETKFDYEDVRDFLVLHYKATERNDSEFWKYCANAKISDSLQNRIDLFKDSGRIYINDEELFKLDSWLAVLIGQGITPNSFDPLTSVLAIEEVKAGLNNMSMVIEQTAKKQLKHKDFLKEYGLMS